MPAADANALQRAAAPGAEADRTTGVPEASSRTAATEERRLAPERESSTCTAPPAVTERQLSRQRCAEITPTSLN